VTFEVSSCTKFQISGDPAGGAYSAPPDPIAGGEGARCTSSRTQPLALGPSGLMASALRPLLVTNTPSC